MRGRWMWSLVVVAAAGVAGCAPAAEQPGDTIEAYVRAVKARDAEAIWALMDEDARLGLDEDAFEAFIEAHYDSILEQAQALEERADGAQATIEAEVPVASSRSAQLTWREGAWYMAQPVPTGQRQDTPRDVLNAFIAALQERSLDDMLALLSQNRRGAVVGEFDVLREQIAAGLDGELVTRGDRAVLKLDNGDRIVLIREEGKWHIEGFERGE